MPEVPVHRTHLLGAILAYVPSGQAILKSVATTARPPEGTVVFSALDRSYPAERHVLREGMAANLLSNLTWRHSGSSIEARLIVI